MRATVCMSPTYLRTLTDELARDDSYCDCCSMGLRRALTSAAERGDRNWIFCQECRRRWSPSNDKSVDEAVRGWVLVFVPGSSIPVAILCGDCATEHPEPTTLPAVARLVLEQSHGPVQ